MLGLLLSLVVVVPSGTGVDLFLAPPELEDFARNAAVPGLTEKARLDALVGAIFRPREKGGLGMEYDNSYTRTVPEVWRDRKANCLSLTALCVAACRAVGLTADFAEVLGTSAWSREGSLVRQELHVVALVRAPSAKDQLVVDFAPQVRERIGGYALRPLSTAQVTALFHSNRAAELLGQERLAEALGEAKAAVAADPGLTAGWNVTGLALKSLGQWAEAETAYRTAMSLDPQAANVLNNLEILLRESGRGSEADRVSKLAHKARERNPYYQSFLAEEALSAGDLDEAMKRIKRAIKRQKHEPRFLVTQARILVAEGRLESATEALERARSLAAEGERQRYDFKLIQLRERLAAREDR